MNMTQLKKITVVFVHGYSVTDLNTYGGLPLRLKAEGAGLSYDVNIEEIFLGQYISFQDEIKLDDISLAFESAVNDQLDHLLKNNERFICITHSTGGPVIRNWWSGYYYGTTRICPMSHLIMLAPANFGSTLAQLGKGRISRLKSWLEGVEPGQGVLNWLELGSQSAWELNKEWIFGDDAMIGPKGMFPFVLTGQSIDRKFYDNLNSYTGELGSDGVIRAAAANLNSRYIKLVQGSKKSDSKKLNLVEFRQSPGTAFRIIRGKAHSGEEMGIMASVKKDISDKRNAETVKAIYDCIRVTDKKEYDSLQKQFNDETIEVQKKELKETIKEKLFRRTFIHSRYAMVVFRIRDSNGIPLSDFDLLFTGPGNDPDHLPEGFFADRQQNRINRETVTYYFNYDAMTGKNIMGENLNPGNERPNLLGLEIRPRPVAGFIRYLPCKLEATVEYLEKVLQPNTTTLLDIVLQRNVDKQVFRLKKLKNDAMPPKDESDFKDIKPGDETI
jgi:hypothetical protein